MTTDTVKVEIVRDEEGVKIAEYSRTLAALSALEEKHKGMVFDVTTTAGMKEAKAARKELRELRVALEKKRKDLKAPVLDYTRALDGQAKAITARIEALEAPIDQQVKAEEQRKAREKAEAEAAERARIDAHRRVIEAMRNKPLAMIGAKPADLEAAFHEIQRTDLSGLEEFAGEAALVKDEAAGKLHELWTQAREAEAAAIRENVARVEREKKEAEERAAREAEQAELEELRRFKAEKEAAEEAKNRDARVPPEMLGVDMANGPDATVRRVVTDAVTTGTGTMEVGEQGARHVPQEEMAAQDVAFDVTVEWSGYSRGHSLYRVMAADASEAMELWADGELIERSVVRDDTEGEPVQAKEAS